MYKRDVVMFDLHQLPFQSKDILPNLLDHSFELLIAFPGGVIQTPILVKWSADERTTYIAAHRDGNIRGGNCGNQLRILGLFHIDSVQLFHQADSVLIDLRFSFGSSRIALEHIRGKRLAERFSDLAAAGIVDADKGYLFLTHEMDTFL